MVYKFIYNGASAKLLKALEDGGISSYGGLRALLRKGEIRVNSKKVYQNLVVERGDEIAVYGVGSDAKILYEDANILAVYKRKGIKTDGNDGFFGEIKRKLDAREGGEVCLSLCHRLDTNTDGIVLFAKNAGTEEGLLSAFRSRAVKKKYLALVYGLFQDGERVCRAYILKDGEKGRVSVFAEFAAGRSEIITVIKTLKKYPSLGLSLLEISIPTGKTHQIRAHLAYLGFPVIGDGKYGLDEINRYLRVFKQQLTAVEIGFDFQNGDPLSYLNEIKLQLDNPLSYLRIGNNRLPD